MQFSFFIKGLKHTCTTLTVMILLFSSLQAQPPCATNPVADDFCATATPICNLNGYCGNTSATYTNTVSPTNPMNETFTPLGDVFCATIQNNSWLKFIADSNVAVFNVWVSNCAHNHGIQMQIYETTDCYNFTSVSNCWNPMFPTNGQILATNLVVGNEYYFMIDGTQGDVCDYVIACDVGVNVSPSVTASQQLCQGVATTLTAVGGVTYLWSSNPPDPGLSGQTTNATINVTPTSTTTYTVTVTNPGLNNFCTGETSILTTTVTINTLSAQIAGVVSASCGQNNGSITVMATGGSGTYTYLWNTTPPQTTPMISGLPSGYYTVTINDGMCNSTLVIGVPEIPPPVAAFPAIPAMCSSALPVSLIMATPTGGIYTGTGVTGTVFDPAVSGAGIFTLTYTVTDATGCVSTATQTVEVYPTPNATMAPLANRCENGSPLILNTGSPAGGTYSGNGVSGTTFYPGIAGPGTYDVRYIYTNTNGCSDTATQPITVYEAPDVTFASLTDVCSDAGIITLSGGNPVGGIYSGTGVSGTSFNPAVTGAGSFVITYIFTNPNGCSDTATQPLNVYLPPVVTFGTLSPCCESVTNYNLNTGNPSGGTYSGPGVTGNIFNAVLTGQGTFTITYSYTDPHGCSGSQSQTLSVVPTPVVTMSAFPSLCIDHGPFLLTTGSPSGGTYSGTGVQDTIFDPSVSGTGSFSITYVYMDGSGCFNYALRMMQVNPLPVVTLMALPDLCIHSAAVSLTGGSPAGGAYLGPGVSYNIFYPDSAGTGTFSINYTFMDTEGCDDTATQSITVNSLPESYHVIGGGFTCASGEGALIALDSSQAGVNYQMILNGLPEGAAVTGIGDTLVFGHFTLEGQYWANALNPATGCSNFMSDSVTVTLLAQPTLVLEDSVYICEETSIQLDAGSFQDAVTYEWQDGSTGRYFTAVEPGYYWVKVDNGACFTKDSIEVKACSDLLIPNVITPNDDMKNDRFKPKKTGDVQEYKVEVFDRWGKLMYQSNDIDEGWDGSHFNDGSECAAGVYYYIITYRVIAYPQMPKARKQTGAVTIIR
ncbi:MAG: gliding motility-associated C-terminal domain-containing protein [Bacteroidetes bacterium]|nr:gliding motility-associated C-terminal domain-containing protein [Bacteroidota bacterium]